jgi:hypothetical protein
VRVVYLSCKRTEFFFFISKYAIHRSNQKKKSIAHVVKDVDATI